MIVYASLGILRQPGEGENMGMGFSQFTWGVRRHCRRIMVVDLMNGEQQDAGRRATSRSRLTSPPGELKEATATARGKR